MHSDHFIALDENTYGELDTVRRGDVFSFNYNPDLSGEVLINSNSPHDPDNIDLNSQDFDVAQKQLVVPGWMLLEFIGRYMQREVESKIDDTSGREFLGLLLP